MPRLTNNEIDKIVDGLTDHIQEKIEDIKSERVSIVKQIIESRYSTELKVLISRKDQHLNRIHYDQLTYCGKYNSVRFDQEIVAPDNYVEIKGANAQKLIDLDGEENEIRRKLEKLERELVATLRAIGTHDKLKKEFPEAYAFLPENAKAVPALNLDKIRLDLKTLIK